MKEEQLTAYLKGAYRGRRNTIKSAELERVLHMSGTFRVPAQAQRSGLRGKRRSDGAGEFFAARRKRASAVRDDERKLVNKLRRKSVPICSGRDGYFYAKNAGDIVRTIRALRVMIKGLQAAVDGLLAALDKFEETGSWQGSPPGEKGGEDTV